MNEVADFTDTGKDLLIMVDLAHKALEKINAEIGEAVEAATAKINAEYTPLVFESQSVLYEAMAKAASCRVHLQAAERCHGLRRPLGVHHPR